MHVLTHLRQAALVLLATGLAAARGAPAPHLLLDNFSTLLAGEGEMGPAVVHTNAAVGLAAAELGYAWPGPSRGRLGFWLAQPRPIAGPGTLRLWVRGDNSTNALQLILRHGRPFTDDAGNLRYADERDLPLPGVRLDFAGWRELSYPVPEFPAGQRLFWRGLTLDAQPPSASRGRFGLDDLRWFSTQERPPACFGLDMLDGTPTGDVGRLTAWVDLRNFTAQPMQCRVRLTVSDRNESPVSTADEEITVPAGKSLEQAITLDPDDRTPFVPPFRVQGDVLSPDAPGISARLARSVVLPNACTVFELFADVFGGWGTRACNAGEPLGRFTEGETYRLSPYADGETVLTRVAVDPKEPNAPATPFALRVSFRGPTAVFNYLPMSRRYLPGDAVRLGFWIRGDESGAPVDAILHDFSDMTDFWPGGWKRIIAEPRICTLDFSGWRYFEIGLPGGGLGRRSPKGSSHEIDLPLELAGVRIGGSTTRTRRPAVRRGAPARPDSPPAVSTESPPEGEVDFGPIQAITQQPAAESLALFVGYDDPNHIWKPEAQATVVVQNGSLLLPRNVQMSWLLRDAAGDTLASGKIETRLAACAAQTIVIDLRPHAEASRRATGPLSLQVTAALSDDASANVTREIGLAKPDTRHLHADFEDARTWLALEAHGTPSPPSDPTLRGQSVSQPVHGGTGALALPWSTNAPLFVAIDPDLPGIPVRISLWLHGDGSGARFQPVLADRAGISKGIPKGSWDFVNVRANDGRAPGVVTVDWTGWRQLEFVLPPIPGGWRAESPVESFQPSYPLGLHLSVAAPRTPGAGRGILTVDDVVIDTHLPAEQRIGAAFVERDEANVQLPGTPLELWVWNSDLVARGMAVSGSILDWLGRRVAGGNETLQLAPGERRRLTLIPKLPSGVFLAQAHCGPPPAAATATPGVPRAAAATGGVSLNRDLVVVDPVSLLGAAWRERLNDPWLLRAPVGCRFELVDEDWDWVEHHPGNLQTLSARARCQQVRARSGEAWLLLGYSAYWAAGEGFLSRQADAFWRRGRDIGHGVDIFMVPEQITDWDNYVREMFREASDDTDGWIVWNAPDAPGPLHVPAGRLAEMLAAIGRWRAVYTPSRPVLLGGLQPESGVGYLDALRATNALIHIDGVQLRLDPGRSAPEDARLVAQAEAVQQALGTTTNGEPKVVRIPSLDWAVELDGTDSLGVMQQAAYLTRAALLLGARGFLTEPLLFNSDFDRVGFGLVYRQPRSCTPVRTRTPVLQLKPAWVALARLHARLPTLRPLAVVPVADTRPNRTRCHLFGQPDGTFRTAIWRIDDTGWVDFSGTGLGDVEATDLLGAIAVRDAQGRVAIGPLPLLFNLPAASGEAVAARLARLRVVEQNGTSTWPQQILAAWEPAAASAGYAAEKARPVRFTGRTFTGDPITCDGLAFEPDGSETLRIVPHPGAGIVLRQEWWLAETGQRAEMLVEDQPVGALDLSRTNPELSSGLRGAVWLIPAAQVSTRKELRVRVRYPKGGNSIRWTACAYTGGPLPLGALGPVHADQPVESVRLDRNVIGSALQVATRTFGAGLGTFAPSLLEYALNDQFGRFTAQVGIDAATEGKGSVVFEVAIDGQKVWSSGPMSGLDAPRAADVPLPTGARRLRLTVSDGGDGNRFDAADWCDAALQPRE